MAEINAGGRCGGSGEEWISETERRRFVFLGGNEQGPLDQKG